MFLISTWFSKVIHVCIDMEQNDVGNAFVSTRFAPLHQAVECTCSITPSVSSENYTVSVLGASGLHDDSIKFMFKVDDVPVIDNTNFNNRTTVHLTGETRLTYSSPNDNTVNVCVQIAAESPRSRFNMVCRQNQNPVTTTQPTISTTSTLHTESSKITQTSKNDNTASTERTTSSSYSENDGTSPTESTELGTEPQTCSNTSKDNMILIVGIAVGAVMVLNIVVIIGIVYCMRKRKASHHEGSQPTGSSNGYNEGGCYGLEPCQSNVPIIHLCIDNELNDVDGVYVSTGQAPLHQAIECICSITPSGSSENYTLIVQKASGLHDDSIKFMFKVDDVTVIENTNFVVIRRLNLTGGTRLTYSSSDDNIVNVCVHFAVGIAGGAVVALNIVVIIGIVNCMRKRKALPHEGFQQTGSSNGYNEGRCYGFESCPPSVSVINVCIDNKVIDVGFVYVSTLHAPIHQAVECTCSIKPSVSSENYTLYVQRASELDNESIKFMFKIDDVTVIENTNFYVRTRINLTGETRLTYSSPDDNTVNVCVHFAAMSDQDRFSMVCRSNLAPVTTKQTTISTISTLHTTESNQVTQTSKIDDTVSPEQSTLSSYNDNDGTESTELGTESQACSNTNNDNMILIGCYGLEPCPSNAPVLHVCINNELNDVSDVYVSTGQAPLQQAVECTCSITPSVSSENYTLFVQRASELYDDSIKFMFKVDDVIIIENTDFDVLRVHLTGETRLTYSSSNDNNTVNVCVQFAALTHEDKFSMVCRKIQIHELKDTSIISTTSTVHNEPNQVTQTSKNDNSVSFEPTASTSNYNIDGTSPTESSVLGTESQTCSSTREDNMILIVGIAGGAVMVLNIVMIIGIVYCMRKRKASHHEGSQPTGSSNGYNEGRCHGSEPCPEQVAVIHVCTDMEKNDVANAFVSTRLAPLHQAVECTCSITPSVASENYTVSVLGTSGLHDDSIKFMFKVDDVPVIDNTNFNNRTTVHLTGETRLTYSSPNDNTVNVCVQIAAESHRSRFNMVCRKNQNPVTTTQPTISTISTLHTESSKITQTSKNDNTASTEQITSSSYSDNDGTSPTESTELGNEPQTSKDNMILIVGIAVGAVVALNIVVIIAIVYCMRKRKASHHEGSQPTGSSNGYNEGRCYGLEPCPSNVPIIHLCIDNELNDVDVVYVRTGQAPLHQAIECTCSITPSVASENYTVSVLGTSGLHDDSIKFMFKVDDVTVIENTNFGVIRRLHLTGETRLTYSSPDDNIVKVCVHFAVGIAGGAVVALNIVVIIGIVYCMRKRKALPHEGFQQTGSSNGYNEGSNDMQLNQAYESMNYVPQNQTPYAALASSQDTVNGNTFPPTSYENV
ncbi:hypothetical protein ACF0H5_007182 [Mactra antiquata]